MVTVLWPDGTRTRGETATACLEMIAKVQWSQPMTVTGVKYVLAARAYGWNATVVDPTLPDDEFVRSLGNSGMVFVTEEKMPWE